MCDLTLVRVDVPIIFNSLSINTKLLRDSSNSIHHQQNVLFIKCVIIPFRTQTIIRHRTTYGLPIFSSIIFAQYKVEFLTLNIWGWFAGYCKVNLRSILDFNLYCQKNAFSNHKIYWNWLSMCNGVICNGLINKVCLFNTLKISLICNKIQLIVLYCWI